MTRRRGRTEHVLWFRWESFPPQEERWKRATLAKLTDPERRPPVPREELCQEVVNSVPERSFELDLVEFLVSVSSWHELDEVNVEDAFFRRVPRFLLSVSLGLRERYRAKQEGDVTAEARGWKLFVLVPMMILNKTSGTSTIGWHQELTLTRGRWRELLEEALRHTQPSSRHTLTEEEEVK